MIPQSEIETERVHRPTNDPVDVTLPPVQRSPRTDPDLRDGDSSHGNPNEAATEEPDSSDRDVGDTTPSGPLSAEAAGMEEHDPEEEGGLEKMRTEFADEASSPPAGGQSNQEDVRTIDNPARHKVDEQMRKDFAREAGQQIPTPPQTTPRPQGPPSATVPPGTPGLADLPISSFAQLTVPEIIRKSEGLTPDELRVLLAYERAHRNRKTLVTQLERWARGDRRGRRRMATSGGNARP